MRQATVQRSSSQQEESLSGKGGQTEHETHRRELREAIGAHTARGVADRDRGRPALASIDRLASDVRRRSRGPGRHQARLLRARGRRCGLQSHRRAGELTAATLELTRRPGLSRRADVKVPRVRSDTAAARSDCLCLPCSLIERKQATIDEHRHRVVRPQAGSPLPFVRDRRHVLFLGFPDGRIAQILQSRYGANIVVELAFDIDCSFRNP